MKKLAILSTFLVTLLALTACENRNVSNPSNQPPTRDRTAQPPHQGQMPPGDRDQGQR